VGDVIRGSMGVCCHTCLCFPLPVVLAFRLSAPALGSVESMTILSPDRSLCSATASSKREGDNVGFFSRFLTPSSHFDVLNRSSPFKPKTTGAQCPRPHLGQTYSGRRCPCVALRDSGLVYLLSSRTRPLLRLLTSRTVLRGPSSSLA